MVHADPSLCDDPRDRGPGDSACSQPPVPEAAASAARLMLSSAARNVGSCHQGAPGQAGLPAGLIAAWLGSDHRWLRRCSLRSKLKRWHGTNTAARRSALRRYYRGPRSSAESRDTALAGESTHRLPLVPTRFILFKYAFQPWRRPLCITSRFQSGDFPLTLGLAGPH